MLYIQLESLLMSMLPEGPVNVCALDLSKAFDRMNHCALFIKIMNRNTPVNLLAVFNKWFAISVTNFFNLVSGVRQGGVLSPSLFVTYVDDICLENYCSLYRLSYVIDLHRYFSVCRRFILDCTVYSYTTIVGHTDPLLREMVQLYF